MASSTTRFLAPLERGLNDISERAAERFVRLVRDTSPTTVERVMQTPARLVVIEAIFWQMPRRYDRERGKGVNATVRWIISDATGDVPRIYELDIADGRCNLRRGARDGRAKLTITLSSVEFLRIAAGLSEPTKAYFAGRVKLQGDIMLAAKLGGLFRMPKAS